MKNFRFGDFIAAGIILVAAALSLKSAISKKNGRVKVVAAGQSYEFSLSKDGNYEVQGLLGPTKIQIKDGRVRIVDSPCPNKNCVHQRWAPVIACLPNDVLVYTEESQGEFDAIAE
ncbi:MAG: NusG domain II-containing protein [Treponema sp.]|nr:NusG domain II-containing protein [Treponema sp.]